MGSTNKIVNSFILQTIRVVYIWSRSGSFRFLISNLEPYLKNVWISNLCWWNTCMWWYRSLCCIQDVSYFSSSLQSNTFNTNNFIATFLGTLEKIAWYDDFSGRTTCVFNIQIQLLEGSNTQAIPMQSLMIHLWNRFSGTFIT